MRLGTPQRAPSPTARLRAFAVVVAAVSTVMVAVIVDEATVRALDRSTRPVAPQVEIPWAMIGCAMLLVGVGLGLLVVSRVGQSESRERSPGDTVG